MELKIGDRCERSHKISEYRNVPAEEHRVSRAHEWFDLFDDEFDQAVFRQTPEQNRFDQHVGNDLLVDGGMFEVIGNEQIDGFLEGDGADRALSPDDQPVGDRRNGKFLFGPVSGICELRRTKASSSFLGKTIRRDGAGSSCLCHSIFGVTTYGTECGGRRGTRGFPSKLDLRTTLQFLSKTKTPAKREDRMALLNGGGEHMSMVETTTWIPICCVCQQVRDDRQNNDRSAGRNAVEKWTSLRSFLHVYRIARGAYNLTHTYCPDCMPVQLGLGRPKLEERLVQPRAKTRPAGLREQIISDQMT